LQRILKLFSVILHFSVEFIPHVWEVLLVAASDTQPEPTNRTNTKTIHTTTDNTVQVQIASAMDDCGTNEIRTIEMTKAEEREYNEGMAKLAEMWG